MKAFHEQRTATAYAQRVALRAVLLIVIADVPSVICFGILLAPNLTRPRLVSDVATIRQHSLHGVPASLCATPRSVRGGGFVSAESDFRRRCSGTMVARPLSAGSGGESERGIEEDLAGKRNEKLAKKEGGVLKAVSGLRDLLGIVLLCSYITAMLSLDFYWAAINPQNFGFVVSMLTISLGINKWRFNSNNVYENQPPPALLPVCILPHTRTHTHTHIRTHTYTPDQSFFSLSDSLPPTALPLSQQSWAQRYAIFMTIISILIPWALLLSGNNFYRRLMVLAPHLYLVMAQASALHLFPLSLSLSLFLSLSVPVPLPVPRYGSGI
jgi:hypothetical protein